MNILNKTIKKTAVAMSVMFGLTLSISQANAVVFNDVDVVRAESLKDHIITSFTEGQPTTAMITGLKRLDETNNYLFKYEENGSSYTMMYMEDLKSIFIQSTSEIYSLENKTFLTKDYNASFVKEFMKEIDEKDIIKYQGADQEHSTDVFVFTDPTCGYCQKLHREVEQFQALNININYLPFPRGGSYDYGYKQWVNVMCATDRKSALSDAKISQLVPSIPPTTTPEQIQVCKDTVMKYYNLGVKMGIQGTPAIFSENGNQLGGYVPAENLRELLNSENSKTAK